MLEVKVETIPPTPLTSNNTLAPRVAACMLSPKAPDSPDRFVTDIFQEVAENTKTKRTGRRKSRDRTDRRMSRDRSRSWCKRRQAAQSKSANASSSDRPAAKEIPAKARPATLTLPAKAANTSLVKAAPRTANTTEAARQQREEQRRKLQQPKNHRTDPHHPQFLEFVEAWEEHKHHSSHERRNHNRNRHRSSQNWIRLTCTRH